jgi:tetratricopeptide (TPR) repeat protein
MADGKLPAAIQKLTEAIEADPGAALAYNARGYAYLRARQYTEAIADFDKAIELRPNYANAYANRSAAKRSAGDKAGADADMAKSRELSDQH